MATASLTIRIDEEDKKQIELIAKKNDRSVSYTVNQAVKKYLQDIEKNSND